MSTRGTIFLTRDGEHCYEDTAVIDTDDNGNTAYRMTFEVDKRNIKYIDNDHVQGVVIEIDGTSEIAGLLRTIRQ